MRAVFIVLVAVISVFVLEVCVHFEDEKCIETVQFVCPAEGNETERVSLYHTDGTYYAFLPSFADFGAMHIECARGYALYIDGTNYHTGKLCTALQPDKQYSLVLKSLLGRTLFDEKLVIMQAQNVATLSVHLTDGTIEDINTKYDKSVTKTGTCSIIEPGGRVEYSGNFKSLKGRGQVSWFANKKSYNISFSDATNLFDMGDNTEYCLLANAFDNSKLRNKIAYDVAREFGVDSAIDSEFVDLYVNNEYLGLYLLTESIHVGEDGIDINPLEQNTAKANYLPLYEYDAFEKIDGKVKKKGFSIPNNPADITGGYLVQSDLFSRYAIRTNTFTTNINSFQKTPFLCSVKYPKYVSAEQLDYLYNYLRTVEDSFSGDFEENIDVDAFVRYYLVREALANFDVNSTYFYKDSDAVDKKLHIGPIWDFDLSLGNYIISETPRADAFYIHTWGICRDLYQNERFTEYVKAAYPEFRELINTVLDEKIAAYAAQINNSYAMNQKRWSELDELPETYRVYKALHSDINTLDDCTDYLQTYLSERMNFLDKTFLDNKTYYTVFINMANVENRYERYVFSVEKGGCLDTDSFKIPERENFEFVKFLDVHTGKEYDITQPVTRNASIIAKWKKTGEMNTTPATEQSPIDENSGFIKRFVYKFYMGKNRFKYYGLTVLFLAVGVFILVDILRAIKSRRYRNGKH